MQLEWYKGEIQRLQNSEAEIQAMSINYASLLKEREVWFLSSVSECIFFQGSCFITESKCLPEWLLILHNWCQISKLVIKHSGNLVSQVFCLHRAV